jgi:hypothetical protein
MSLFVNKLFSNQSETTTSTNMKVTYEDVIAISELIEEILDTATAVYGNNGVK